MQITAQELGDNVRKICEDDTCSVYQLRDDSGEGMMPQGYDTVIGEGGGTLSGGEKQRISIARSILKDAPVVILDEATASVDPENEHLIQQAISELVQGKTIITIAHRLATIENADQILVIDGGHLSQVGTHAELIKKPGVYRNFIRIRERAEGWHIA